MRTKVSTLVLLTWGLVALLLSESSLAQTPLTTVRVYPPSAIPTALVRPLFACAAPGDTTRLFIVEQRLNAPNPTVGRIQILNLSDNTLNGTPFYSFTGVSTGNEEGLLGFAFHPDFFADAPDVNRGAFFTYSTRGGNNHVHRYTTVGQDPTANADNATEQLVITFSHPGASNHNGGWIGFGPDGFLYIATGDGGGACDGAGNAQLTTSYLGKMHRLDVDADQNPGSATVWSYLSPSENPFVGVAGLDEIFHYGLRNPWRCSFDRQNGNLYIGDVGQNAREEISLAPASFGGGINFGWDVREGFQCSNIPSSNCSSTCSTTGRINPVWDFVWSAGSAITGGYVYRGDVIPDLKGHYFFANYSNGNIWSFRYIGTCDGGTGQCTAVSSVTTRTAELVPTGPVGGLSISSIVSFGEDAAGEVYIVDQNGGEVFKIVVNCSGANINISGQPMDTDVCEGGTAIFTVVATGLRGATTYTWRKGVDIVGDNSPSLILPGVTAADAGDYNVTVTDQCGNEVSNDATLTVLIPQLGDVSGDCVINMTDVPLFTDVLLEVDLDAGHIARSDINGLDGPNADDIQGFIDLLVP